MKYDIDKLTTNIQKIFPKVEYIDLKHNGHYILCYEYANIFGERNHFYTNQLDYWYNNPKYKLKGGKKNG